MSGFTGELKKWLEASGDLPAWNRHIPDSLYASIANLDDFMHFIDFINDNLGSERLEYGCESTAEFLSGLTLLCRDVDANETLKKQGIKTEFGALAYFMVLAMGNR